ncbi:pericentrin isoform X3 [Pteronotus mesoamericanus]|uniref:pericentrin isoform X3 n=1 Tax=Pteronotus mesoamericanus TaxID=1884717 RepID=UPI0023EC5F5D|nr:pericentrin isoform X3 [Pteronotus parnellii mesoamericanus]
MEDDEQEQRRRKVEAGRAKLAHFRQRKTKSDCAHSKKKTAKRKGSAVDAPVQEESPVATEDSGFLGGGDICKTPWSSDTPDGAAAAQLENPDGARTEDSEWPWQKLDGDVSEQPGALTKDCEQECTPEIAELMSQHEDKTGREQWAMVGLPAEMQQVQLQTQPVPPLELEALRLSLNNMHTAQLELTQANLQREKETALTELRDMLNGRHAQELALLQSRQRLELELVREQHMQEQEEVALRCSQEIAELKEKLQSEMERNVQIIENLKQDWETERDLCLENLHKELTAKHQSELENLQSQFKKELAEQKAELEKIFQAKNQAELSLQTLRAQHDAAVKKLREELQSERCQHAEDLDLRVREKEREKQLELENLQASYEELKAQSQEEVRRLWSQLESMKTDRQELSGEDSEPQKLKLCVDLREQLLARASHMEELEHLQRDFEQQQQREKTEHESELEQLRLYFEKKLRDAEKNYQEDLTLLQQRLQEVREDSLLESAEMSSSSAVLEETSEKERRDRFDQLSFQLEQDEEDLCLHTQLEESPQHQVAAQQEADLVGTQVLAQHVGLPEEPGPGLACVHLQGAQDPAVELETEVATTVLGLETEHKVKLSLFQRELQEEINLLKIENQNLHKKLQQEIRLKEDLEKVKHNLVEDHQEELRKAKEQIQLMKQELKEREAEWKGTSEALKREAEEKLTLMLLDLREQAELEKQSIINKFELREIEMRQLQDQQAAQILDLEGSLKEQQGRLQQLELDLTGDESLQCGQEPSSGLAPVDQNQELATLHLKEDRALQLMLAQNRFLEQRKEITEKFTAEQDALLREAQEKHANELQLLQERHQQHILSLTTELEAKHQANIEELKAVFQREQCALAEARVAELQAKHAAAIHALETRHLSHLDSVESSYLSEIQTLRDEHKQALELLQAGLKEQLQKKDSSHQAILTQELEKLQQKHSEELESAKRSWRTEQSTEHSEGLKALAAELREAHQEELAVALRNQRRLLEEEKTVALDKVRAEVLLLEQQHQAALQELGDMHAAEMQRQRAEQQGEFELEKKAALHEKEERHRLDCERVQSVHQKEKESLSLQLQEKSNQILQLEDQIASLRREIEECHSELETLQRRRDRENQEGTNLISMLKSDVDLSHSERIALQEALRRLLGLFGETLKAAIIMKGRISERVGLCLEDESPPNTRLGGQSPSAAPALDEMWPGPDVALTELDKTLTECTEMSSMAEISSHICESFFMSPESTLECEQPVRSIYRSLSLAVDSLLEMVLDSSKQLEEARQIHARFEKEFTSKSEEMAQVVRKHQELLERLEEENSAKTQLTLDLHKAEGIIEGFKVEKASLQEALGLKETSEQGLVAELESLKQQLQRVTRQQEELKEKNSVLWHQKEVAATEAEEREAALRREVEAATTERLETRQQCEKDRAALHAQVKLLEAELEEQVSRHRACASQAEELCALRQQMVSLDKHLRSQRQFMDEQAVEREHEREDFQQEIQRLEEQLRRAAQLQSRGPRDSDQTQLDEEVELLQEKLREKSDELNELVMKKELSDRQVLIQEEEIKHLEETNADTRRKVTQLQEELEKQRKAVQELQQDKEALQQQQMSNLLLVSTLQSKLDEGKCPLPPADSCPEGPKVQLETVQRALLQRESEVLELKEQLEKIKDDLISKSEEVLHLNLKLDLQNNHAAISVRGLQEENANLKAFLQNKEKEILHMSEQLEAQLTGMGSGALSEVMYSRSSEVEELKSIIETLQENQERLQKDKAEEIEQLHEVIEKLQRELTLGGPAEHELGDSQAEDLQSELAHGLLCLQAEGAEAQAALQAELQAALVAKEALSQLLAEQEHQHGQALEALQQRLRVAEEAAARQLAQLGHSSALQEAEIQGLASQIQEFEAALKAKDAEIAQKDLEIETMNRRRSAHSTELEAILLAFSRLRRTLEQQPLGAMHEPPELLRLRVQCVRLSRQLQALNQQFLRCQKELDKQQASRAPVLPCVKDSFQGRMARGDKASCDEELEQDESSRQQPVASCGQGSDPQSPVKANQQSAKALVTVNHTGLHEQDSVMSVLTVCQRQLESELLLVKNEMQLSAEDHGKASGTLKVKERLLKDYKLQKVDVITQVKQLQEKLNHLVYSMNLQNVQTEDFNSQQPLAFSHVVENSSSGSSTNGEETDQSSPVDTIHISKIPQDLIDIIGNQDSLIRRNEMPHVPMEDKGDLQDGSLCLQASLPSSSRDLTYTEEAEPLKSALSAMDLSFWSSPEVVRKDSTLEPLSSLPVTPCLDAMSQRNLDTSLRDRTSPSLLQADQSGLLCSPRRTAAVKAPCWAESSLATDRAPSADHHVRRSAMEKDVEDFIITSLDSQEKSRLSPLGLEGKSNGSENSNDAGCGEILNQGSTGLEALTASPAVPPPASGSFQHLPEAMKEKEVHPKQVKALLQMVYDESHHILALSEYHGYPSALSKGEPSAPIKRFLRGGQGLLETVPALRGHMTSTPQQGEKFQEPADTCLDWRGEFLQVVQEAFEKEREMLTMELQPQLCGAGPRADGALVERLQKVVQEQGDLQEKSLEHLRQSDRSSLLSEIQALRAQLRLTHLQNQEKLQQLCAALTSAEARGSRQEHQLRRQVELLAYKVEQEKCIASDLQKTLSEEQEKANNVRKLLVVEQNTVKTLKSELCECKQDNERLLKSLNDVQMEVLQLRSILDSKENDLKATLQELEDERAKERALQSRLEQEQLQHLQREGQNSKALEELRISLEKQYAQNNQLCVALKHEQTVKDNLQKELQIESSRCEALLAQERSRVSKLHWNLETAQGRSLELSEALQHERVLTEQLSRRAQEACAHQETQAHRALLRKLKDETARVAELQAALEKVQQHAVQAQQQLEAEVQRRCTELEREKEVSARQRSTVQALRTPKPELSCDRDREREKPTRLQAELEQLHSRPSEQGFKNARRRVETRQNRADTDKRKKWQRDKEKLRELELQRQRHEHKIKQLQRKIRELEAREVARLSPESEHLREQQQGLETVRQQLLCTAGLLTNFISQTVDRTLNDWTSSNEKAVTHLLRTLEDLKSKLSTSNFSQKKMTAEVQVQLVDVLLKENDSLTQALNAMTQEKAELCRATSRLEKTLKHHLLKGCALSRSDRSSWRRDRAVPQSSPGLPDQGLPAPASREEANTSNGKMEKLYLHYLRAESFRKALIYQKKYLLLLIGGFQDSEQETLSMIAHLGVFPSKADKKITTSRPFTRFRTAVRVVIAISRLRFLVKKWQEVDRKGALVQGRAPRTGISVSRQQLTPPETSESLPETSESPPESSKSPPTRDVSSSHTRDSVPKASPRRRERSNPSPNSRSLTASQDPEHSLTEFIHHLEMIQQRLGGVPPDSTSKKSCRQKTKQ